MASKQQKQGLAVVTGASTGIGYELAKVCAENGFDLIIVADEPITLSTTPAKRFSTCFHSRCGRRSRTAA
jgi:short-subunit dehydrogenase